MSKESGTNPKGEFHDQIEQVMARLLELPESRWSSAADEACAEHPEYAHALRRRLKHLERSHLLDASTEFVDLPQRLGSFQLLKELGGGGMGVVYLARKDGSDQEVALKLVRPDYVLFRGARQRFAREIKTISRLDHPGIVSVLEVGEVDGVPYFTMECVQGSTLANVMQELRGMDPAGLKGRDFWEVICRRANHPVDSGASVPATFAGTWTDTCFRLVEQVARTLSYAHEQGVLHRDVKPSNIMVTAEGNALLLDFGLAKSSTVSRMTQTGAALGSVPYMAPEQINGEQQVDGRVDVYSLAVTLYEILGFEPPFASTNAERLRRKILKGEPASLRSLNVKVPEAADTVCLTAMEREPSRRYVTAAEFADDLARVLMSAPIQARAAPWYRRGIQWARRHPVLAGAVALLFLQAATAQVVLMSSLRSEKKLNEEAMNEARSARREMQRMKSQTETALLETRQLLDAVLLYSLPLQAEEIEPSDPGERVSLEQWLENSERLLARRPEILRRIQASSSGDPQQSKLDYDRIEERFGVLESLTRKLRDEHERLSSLRWRTLESPEAIRFWNEATDDIFLLDVYGGLELEPVLGLLPLGTDPDTGFWEFAHLQSGEPPERSDGGDDLSPWRIEASTAIILVLLPGGEFVHEVEAAEGESLDADQPRRLQTKLKPFFVSKYEVTQGQWSRIQANNEFRSAFSADLEPSSAPVESISWEEARAWLGRAGLSFPTEMQWEYACRAGTSSRFFSGGQGVTLLGFANFADDSIRIELPLFESRWNDGFGFPAPVGSYKPNPFGLYDVVGNVAEFTVDRFFPTVSLDRRQGDGLQQEASAQGEVVVRGGGWRNRLRDLQSSARESRRAFVRFDDVGLRPVLNLPHRP